MTAASNADGKDAIARSDGAFVEKLNAQRRCRKLTTGSHARRKAPGLSYHVAAKLQPKVCASGPCGPSTSALVARRKIIRKRSSKETGEPAELRAGREGSAPRPRPSKKLRRASPSPSFLSSELLRRRYGGLSPLRAAAKAVTFANPLVTESWTRPRTPRADVGLLFYSRADEARFREEVRRERRLQLLRSVAESGDDEESGSEDECRVVETKNETIIVVVAATSDMAKEDPNEVTESDDSSESDDDCNSSDEEGSDRDDI